MAKIATDVDIVVNNAGTPVPEPRLTGGFDGVAEMFDVNVYGRLRVAKAFAPILPTATPLQGSRGGQRQVPGRGPSDARATTFDRNMGALQSCEWTLNCW
ncbi:hypothetical protein [Mesorhizobium sp. LSHC412B00]|uniref:hypothetical protein n=1 Tax=Mesorhizobium sp. LSHC412B00 TaxID=1287285 RepID=UPI0003CE4752|nr:hypothetical protein [Mesorhizobium sp. LSHC412B00]ESX91315.1 hypothetical protein X756_02760 [Mesorhizobium sp. LSHC412B00]